MSPARLAVTCALAGSLALTGPKATATPLDEPFVGGIGFGGPTSGDLTSVYWNPAALSLLNGTEVHFSGMLRTNNTRVSRPGINATTGQPDPGAPGTSLRGDGTVWPKPWAPGPGWFAGIGANVMGRFTLAVAAYVPSYERLRYQPNAAGQIPGGYHGIDIDLRNFALVPALAVRMGKYLHVGFAPGFLFPGGKLVFDEDTAITQGSAGLAADCGGVPCGYENPTAIARYHIDAGTKPFPTAPAFTLGGGLHYKRDAWSVGVAYSSRALGNDGAGVRLDIRDASIVRAPGGTENPLCPPTYNAPCLNGELSYRLPDSFIAGATWEKNERWSFTAMVRYQTFSQHNRMVLTLAGPAGSDLGQQGLRNRLVLDRGFQDRIELRARAERRWGARARLGFGLRVATSAVPTSHLTPAAIDGLTYQPHAMAEYRLKAFLIRIGYAFAFMTSRTVENSAFSPQSAVGCVDANLNLENPACTDLRQGRARPSGAGTYSQFGHSLSLNLLTRF